MKNVLLVDDDCVFNFISIKTLKRMDFAHNILTALNGDEALELFQTHYKDAKSVPDIILLDLNMPVMDGFGFLEAFQQLVFPAKDQIKIIVLSSSTRSEDISKALRLGAHAYLSKPLTVEGFINALEACNIDVVRGKAEDM